MQYSKTIASLFWKQVQTCSKHDAIKPIHCIITIFKWISICSKDDAIIPKEAREFVLAGPDNAIKTIIVSLFQTVLYMLEIWCNQNKLLHHYFQTALNLFKIWYN